MQIAADETAIPGSGTGMSVRTGVDQVHTLHVMPLKQGVYRPHLVSGAVAAIFVSSSAISHNLARDVLVPLFKLTSSEVSVFELIVAGLTTQEISTKLGVASSTVRTHLLRLFDKTGVNRQSDLIRMAHALSPPLSTQLTKQISR